MIAMNELTPSLRAKIMEEISLQQLPPSFVKDLEVGILPCAQEIARIHSQQQNAPIWGVSGAQGSGKSTLVRFLAFVLSAAYQLRVVTLSIDDFYLSRAARAELAQRVHPLFQTRGVPGTHDVELGRRTLLSLQHAAADSLTPLPQFDKATDDVITPERWPQYRGKPDIILFEGWCVGTQPQPDHCLATPVNALERDEDPAAIWRDYVNQQLRIQYAGWFSLIDALILLKVPSFERVLEWRCLQEEKLRTRLLAEGREIPATLMNRSQVERFIQHYERLTRWNLQILPQRASMVLELQDLPPDASDQPRIRSFCKTDRVSA